MAEDNTPKTTTLALPEGMDAAKVKKILESYETKQKTQYATGKAKRDAVQGLIKRHEQEYNQLLTAAKRKHGVPSS